MVGLLRFADGEPFATGLAACEIGPASPADPSARVLVRVAIEDVETRAVVDTAAPYVVCPPWLAQRINLSSADSIDHIRLNIRGNSIPGHLQLLRVTFPAEEGVTHEVEATVFVPDMIQPHAWGDLPAYIGLTGCLERMRFALDPGSDDFYFGSL